MIQLYKVGASFERDGQTIGCDHVEVLGDAYGQRYASEEEASDAAEELQEELGSTDLDPSTKYQAIKAETLEFGAVTEEYLGSDDEGDELPPDELMAYVSVDVLIDGREVGVATMVGAPESLHATIRAAGCGVRPHLTTWYGDSSDYAAVERGIQPYVLELIAENARQIWREVQELRSEI